MQRIFLTIGQNTLILLGVNLIGAIAGFAMAAALGRGLGESGFGQYSFVMAWLLSLLMFTEFGLSTVLTRDLAASPVQIPVYLNNSLAAKGVLAIPAILFLLVFAPQVAMGSSVEVVAALRWGVIFLVSSLMFSSFTAVFRARQTMLPILWLTLIGQVLLFTGTVVLLVRHAPLAALIGWAGVSQSVQFGLAYLFYRKAVKTFEVFKVSSSGISRSFIKLLLIKAWPFALTGILAAFQMRANVLLLAYLEGDQALGWYAAANRFIEAGRQLPGAFYMAIFPAMAAMIGSQKNSGLRKTVVRTQWSLLAYGLVAALGAWLLAEPIIGLVYGPGYEPAALVLQVLTLALIPTLQNGFLVIRLYVQGREQVVNGLIAISIVINLGLCWWLVPIWGAAGTAAALLIAETILYVLYRFFTH